MRGAGASGGQASLEVIALLPILLALSLVAVYIASLLAAASTAQDRARAGAMRATGQDGAMVTVTGSGPVTALPVLGADAPVRHRVAVRLP